MPLPNPSGKEAQQEFVSRCAGDSTMNKEYPDQRKRVAICYSQWEAAKKRKQAAGSQEDPSWEENCGDQFLLLD